MHKCNHSRGPTWSFKILTQQGTALQPLSLRLFHLSLHPGNRTIHLYPAGCHQLRKRHPHPRHQLAHRGRRLHPNALLENNQKIPALVHQPSQRLNRRSELSHQTHPNQKLKDGKIHLLQIRQEIPLPHTLRLLRKRQVQNRSRKNEHNQKRQRK